MSLFEPTLDIDNDGILETAMEEFDTNGDGIADSWSIQTDCDGDGIVDQGSLIQEFDSDNDGMSDSWVMYTDLDNDGTPDREDYYADTDGDGYPDTVLGNRQENDSNNSTGNLNDDLEHWHQQTYNDTCAIVSQEFILDDLTGQDFSEDELRQLAIDNGWYTPGGGTPLECMGNLLEAHGINVEKDYGYTLEDISNKLAQGEKVLVALDADEIWNTEELDDDDILANLYGMPEQGVNHAVQVVGIDTSNPDNPMIILNDPGSPDGQGLTIPAADFIEAWADSSHYMVSTVTA